MDSHSPCPLWTACVSSRTVLLSLPNKTQHPQYRPNSSLQRIRSPALPPGRPWFYLPICTLHLERRDRVLWLQKFHPAKLYFYIQTTSLGVASLSGFSPPLPPWEQCGHQNPPETCCWRSALSRRRDQIPLLPCGGGAGGREKGRKFQ